MVRAVAPLALDMRPVVVSLGVAPGVVCVLLVTPRVLHWRDPWLRQAPGDLRQKHAVRVEEGEGAGLSYPGTTNRITGIFVRTLHCLDTQELHEAASGERSVPKPGPRILR